MSCAPGTTTLVTPPMEVGLAGLAIGKRPVAAAPLVLKGDVDLSDATPGRPAGARGKRARHQRPTAVSSTDAAAVPAVDVRSTVSPSRYDGRPARRSPVRLIPPSGPTTSTISPPGGAGRPRSTASSRPRAARRDSSPRPAARRPGRCSPVRLTTGHQARRACFAASRAVERQRSSARSPRAPSQRTTHRAADQGTISSTPTSVSISTASSPRSPLASAWTTTIRGVGAGTVVRSRTVSSSDSAAGGSAPRSAPSCPARP